MDRDELRKKAETLRQLHHGPDILVLPNAWDIASARIVEEAGYPAIATTSAGVAFALGYPDGEKISRDEMLDAVSRIARRMRVPVTADLEAGYGPEPGDTEETIRRAIEGGVVGANIEDGTHRREQPLCSMNLAVARIHAARRAAEAAGIPFVINARTDSYLAARIFNQPQDAKSFEETVHRGRAYLEAGADCIFIPGLADPDTIGRLVAAINGPINILAGPGSPSVPELKALGVARVSVGGAIMRATLGLVQRAAAELRSGGTFGFADGAVTQAEMNQKLAR
ncbi:MAG TPA: isocitrate lyase/phosphoenolpyruvate mutase family protein [Alphaproteobacteria bacterium]|nr:isocitrate lyase/phosphoenolpyruvate mutase family protein [Alphaproteobacteria bacterium]